MLNKLDNFKTPKLILLLSGKRKCGKDYIAELLKEKFKDDCELLHLSEPIKEHFAKEKNIEISELMSNNLNKEKIRHEMIKWGEYQRNNIDKFIFCKKVVQKIIDKKSKAKIWIIVDCRRKSDIDYFFQQFKCIILTVRISSYLEVRQSRGFVFAADVDNAESECDLDTFTKWDFLIENNCTVNHFINNFDENINCSFLKNFFNLYNIINSKLDL